MVPPDHLFGPDLTPQGEMILEAFFELGSDRAGGMGVLPIPFSSIDRYAARYGVGDIDDFDMFRRGIRALDEIFLAWKPPSSGAS